MKKAPVLRKCYLASLLTLLSMYSFDIRAEPSKSNTTAWPIHFYTSYMDMDVDYKLATTSGKLSIKASVNYLEDLAGSLPITGQHFYYTPFNWKSPIISVKTENSTSSEILLDKIVFDVKSSEIDKVPIPIFLVDLIGQIGFFNDGWGDIEDAELEIGLLRREYCEGEQTIDRFKFAKMKSIKIGRVHDSFSLDVADLVEAGGFEGPICGVGVLTYKSEDGTKWLVPFRTGVWVGEPLAGAPAPPNASYDLFLPAGKSNYKTELPIAQSVAPKGVDHFQVAFYSDKSAKFEFQGTVVTSHGLEVASTDIELSYFRPRSATTPTSKSSQYKVVDGMVSEIKSMEQFITALEYDPIQASEFVVQVTDDWMLLSNAKRKTLQNKIEEALRKLGITKASFCYRLNSEQCIRYYQYPPD
jgi:hypothetical protein